jgi:predicted CopG family antitoxin
MSRKTISIDEDVYDDLEELKRDDDSWTDLLRRLSTGQGGEHDLNTLTEEHIDDIATETARRTARELENRLNRR